MSILSLVFELLRGRDRKQQERLFSCWSDVFFAALRSTKTDSSTPVCDDMMCLSVSEHDEPLTDVSKHTKTGTDGGKYLLMLLIAIIIIRRVIIYFCFYLWSISICYRAALFQGRD